MKKLTETERGDLARRRTEALERIADALQGHDEDVEEGPLGSNPVAIVQLRGRVESVSNVGGLYVALLEWSGDNGALARLNGQNVLLRFAANDWEAPDGWNDPPPTPAGLPRLGAVRDRVVRLHAELAELLRTSHAIGQTSQIKIDRTDVQRWLDILNGTLD